MKAISAVLAEVERDIQGTASRSVLESYRTRVATITESIEAELADTRSSLIAQEDLLEQCRAVALRIDQRISEESVPAALGNLHPTFASILAPYIAPVKQAA